jgi:high-affinity iron transporter
MFAASARLDVRGFFQVTSVLLIVFAAGLVAHGVHELQEAGLLPILVEHVWDINPILDEKGTLGSIFKSLFGYNGNPWAGHVAAEASSGSGRDRSESVT